MTIMITQESGAPYSDRWALFGDRATCFRASNRGGCGQATTSRRRRRRYGVQDRRHRGQYHQGENIPNLLCGLVQITPSSVGIIVGYVRQ